jgi:NB-ARC domain
VPMVAAIDGPAGVGKTALALRWAHQIAGEFPDGQLYADLGGFGPPERRVAVDTVLQRFLAGMGVTHIPETVAERATHYRSLLAGRKILVVLDNAAKVDDIEQLLPASSSCAVVVTSRRALSRLAVHAGAVRVTLTPLTEQHSIAMLRQTIGPRPDQTETRTLASIAKMCGHLPLALAMAAEQIAMYPRSAIADLVSSVIDDDHGGPLDIIDLREALSWSYDDLEEDAARVFRAVGLHPGPHLSVPAIAALAGLARPHVRKLLHRLASVNLIDIASDGSVDIQSVIHAYARERALDDDSEQRVAAVQRLVTWYLDRLREAEIGTIRGGAASIPPRLLDSNDEADTAAEGEHMNLPAIIAMAKDYRLPDAARLLTIAMKQGTWPERVDSIQAAQQNPAAEARCAEHSQRLCG